ncbi:MAG: hypothetical protein ACFFAX_16885 [Promethearchaeota archaeon]
MLVIGFWDSEYLGEVFVILMPIVFIVLAIVLLRFFMLRPRMRGRFVLETPSFVIGKGNRGQMGSNITEISTGRESVRCSNCGTLLSGTEIKWGGPLEAECSYCGSSVKAQLERV